MRAVVCHELTGPTGLRVDDLPEPQVGAGQVLVETKAAGVNFPDVLITEGKYQFKPQLPFVPGGELAGVVRAVGDGVSSVAVGDRVAVTMLYGASAEQVCCSEASVTQPPDGVSFEVGAAVLV